MHANEMWWNREADSAIIVGYVMSGRSIRLFLVDGTPQGMRTAEVGNWSGLAIVCPRTDLVRLDARPDREVRRTGVYLLLGPSESSPSRIAVYVGEGDEVWARLANHDDKKDWWTSVVLVVSKDNNLTKAHVRWLEARLVAEIRDARRAEVKNGNVPTSKPLPEADESDMEMFLDNTRLLLASLGINVFAADAPASASSSGSELHLELRWEDASAECAVRDGQFVVLKGSQARVKEVDSLGDYSRELRHQLRENGVLATDPLRNTLLRFTQDYAFESPSGAASVVSGTGLNGRVQWKVKGQGISYKDWQEQQVGSRGAGE